MHRGLRDFCLFIILYDALTIGKKIRSHTISPPLEKNEYYEIEIFLVVQPLFALVRLFLSLPQTS